MTTPSLTPRPLCSREREEAGNEFRLPLKKSTTVNTYLNAVCSKRTCVADYEQTYSSAYAHCDFLE